MILMYATGKDGKGYCEEVGRFESWDLVHVRVGMWSDDILLTFVEELKKDEVEG